MFLAALCLAAVKHGAAQTPTPDCGPPGLIVNEDGPQFHPSFAILYFKRNRDPAIRVHDIVRVVTPPKGLGFEPPKLPAPEAGTTEGREAIAVVRTIHVHEDDGVLHVHAESTRVPNACQLIVMWLASGKNAKALNDLLGGRAAHIRIGGKYVRNVPMNEVMRLPLDHDEPMVVFVEWSLAP